MDNNLEKSLECYGLIGKSLCACAGGIIGYVMNGPLLALSFVLIGSVLGHCVEKVIIKRFSLDLQS